MLYDDLPAVYAGLYVLLSYGDRFTLAVPGKDQRGTLCTTSSHVNISARDFCQLVSFGQAVNPLIIRSAPDRTELPTETVDSPGNGA